MTKLGKLWTGAVAYVSLLVGAGLSVAGNLADTYRTRGADVDTLDKVMAAGWPILVLLAIEMFVSPRWSDKKMFQVWRWVGCLAVGGMAMVVSWTHLHDLMGSRGQLFIVSVLGPLAIDGMAIMATGLILSTRVRGHVAMATGTDAATAAMATGTDTATAAMTTDKFASGNYVRLHKTDNPWTDSYDRVDTSGRDRWADLTVPDTDAMTGQSGLTDWADGHDRAIRDLGQELATEAERVANGQPPIPVPVVSADTLPKRTRIPQEFLDRVAAWDGQHPSRADMVKLTADKYVVSTRTARRWLAAALNEPVSGSPSDERR